jgi:hypothetical protein
MDLKNMLYWEKFRKLQAKAAQKGLYCVPCNARRTLGKDVTPEVALNAYRCKTCKTLCLFRSSAPLSNRALCN